MKQYSKEEVEKFVHTLRNDGDSWAQDTFNRAAEMIEGLAKDRDEWKRDRQMFADAWLRELGGRVINKHHLIDALVLTTRDMKFTHDRLVREEAERKRAGLVAEYGPYVEPKRKAA